MLLLPRLLLLLPPPPLLLAAPLFIAAHHRCDGSPGRQQRAWQLAKQQAVESARQAAERGRVCVAERVKLCDSHLASFLRAVRRKSLISLICFGCESDEKAEEGGGVRQRAMARDRRRELAR